MKQGLFTAILIIVTFVVSLLFYFWMGTTPENSSFHAVYQGGPVVAILMALILMVVAYIVERLIALNKAAGKGNIPEFVKGLKQDAVQLSLGISSRDQRFSAAKLVSCCAARRRPTANW